MGIKKPASATGTTGNDVMIGGPATDEMAGGQGDDIYYVLDTSDVVIEAVGEGRDRVAASVSYALAGGSEVEVFEAITLTATNALNLTGNEFSQLIVGNNGVNVLTGGGGNDTMVGAGGNDVFIGSASASAMYGGLGNDTYYVIDGADAVLENGGEGTDRIAASTSYTLLAGSEVETIEAVTLSATTALNFIGNEFAQTLIGNNGANFLNGGGGNDTLVGAGGNDVLLGGAGGDAMYGGVGDDTYYVDSASDLVGETIGEGRDRVATAVSYALAAGTQVEVLEAITLTATDALDLTGNEFSQTLTGNNGVNVFRGGGGNDMMIGAGGNDVFIGNSSASAMYGGLGNDTYYVIDSSDAVLETAGEGSDRIAASTSYTLLAGAEIEVLEAINLGATTALNFTGNEFGQTLTGNNGVNILNGGAGGDVLVGYGGADTFVFNSVLGGSNIDFVADFAVGVDRIQLAGSTGQPFAGLASGALAAGSFVIGDTAQQADDYLLYIAANGYLLYDADGNGAGAAVHFATLTPNLALSAGDFIVAGLANNLPAVASGSTATIAENSPASTVVYQIVATDADGDRIAYSLSGQDAAFFSVDSGGAVRLLNSADFETRASYNITVNARDSSGSGSSRQVTVGVTDVAEGNGPTPTLSEITGSNNTRADAQVINRGVLASSTNPNLFDDDIPSVVIQGAISSAASSPSANDADIDFYSITLDGGEILILDIDSVTNGLDVVIRFYNLDGTEFGYADDAPQDPGSGPHPSSTGATLDTFAWFYAQTGGTYYFTVEAWGPEVEDEAGSGDTTGSYSLNVSIDRLGVGNDLLYFDVQALVSGAYWPDQNPGTPGTNLTYSFPTLASHYPAGTTEATSANGFAPFSALQQQVVAQQVQLFAQVANLTFSQIAPAAGSPANLRYAISTEPDVAYAYYPGSGLGGTAWFNNSDGDFTNPQPGNYAWMAILHETGHALGLKHGHEFPAISYDRDSVEYSVMTYRSATGGSLNGGYTNETYGFPQTLMMLDIAALQRIYGANFNHNSGNTVYSWNPNTGQTSVDGVGQPSPGANRVFMTVWDGGGTDTYNLSAYTNNVLIDLRPGQWTTTSPVQLANLTGGRMAVGNIANALQFNGDARSLIENAIGGSGNDGITANQAVNSLTGGAGADHFLWHSIQDGGVGAQADIITDFVAGQDKINLFSIDANTNTPNDDTFIFIGTNAFSNMAGQLRYQVEGNSIRIQADVDGNGVADLEILLSNTTTPLSFTDFLP